MSTETTPIKLGPTSLTEALFTSLRTRIINGEIPPGEKVTELRVTEEYGVARPTAKACLERLTSMGLLRRTAHRSAVVPVFDDHEIEDLFSVRELFESAALLELAGRRELPLSIIRAQDALKLAVRREDFAEQVQHDIAFHTAIISGAASERLSRLYDVIAGEIHLTMGQFAAHRHAAPSRIAEEHDAITAAVRSGDAEAATAALSAHLQGARDRVLGLWHQRNPSDPEA